MGYPERWDKGLKISRQLADWFCVCLLFHTCARVAKGAVGGKFKLDRRVKAIFFFLQQIVYAFNLWIDNGHP